jgi:hypothetical protein
MMSEMRKGYRILLTMFEISRTMTRRSDRECFNQVVRFLADCARVHPMPKGDRPVADRLIPMAKPLFDAWYDEPYDYLGQLFSERECAVDEMGQVITPPRVVYPPGQVTGDLTLRAGPKLASMPGAVLWFSPVAV